MGRGVLDRADRGRLRKVRGKREPISKARKGGMLAIPDLPDVDVDGDEEIWHSAPASVSASAELATAYGPWNQLDQSYITPEVRALSTFLVQHARRNGWLYFAFVHKRTIYICSPANAPRHF